ncbi:MAG: TAT-variant-translocated molybdopterin oxidoreductase [Planctomycetes bacterium]|nr:TAT-variant-translocated molybdopterin oxidoreductase [Planctomycetota bacterium]
MSESFTTNKYWRSLNELEHTPEFEEMLHREFPIAASEFPQGVSRRRWLQLMGASLALGGLAGCRYKVENIAPLSARPVDRIPGRTEKFATSIELAGGVRHLLMTCYDGRPLKVEGNPDHPAGQRGTDAWAQACILEMYDPDRGSALQHRSDRQASAKNWSDFDTVIGELTTKWKSVDGQGVGILLDPTVSIALRSMLAKFQATFPKAKLYEHASISRQNAVKGSQSAFGQAYRTHLALDKADVIVSLDADLLADDPAALRMAKDFSAGRDADSGSMNRLYVVESQFTVTGAAAVHRLGL